MPTGQRLSHAAIAAAIVIGAALSASALARAASPATPGRCGLRAPTFCDTFDRPAGTGNRSGELDGKVWGASRVSGNEGIAEPANAWPATRLTACGGTTTVRPPKDIRVCNGQLHDAVSDGQTVSVLAMYPKQPFDFTGRTGTITFDVSNDTQGNHAAWPELWVTDTPVPAPFAHEASWTAVPRNGFELRFGGCTDSSGRGASCSRGANAVGVDSALVADNYVVNDSFNGGNLKVLGLDSVLKSGPRQLNHYEVRVSRRRIDVYATDPFSGALDLARTPLRHIATIPNANLGATRGLIWIEDAHYNGDKFGSQGTHTFTWDNVGFDGPLLARDLAFDAPDNTANGDDLGYPIAPSSSRSLTLHGVTGLADASKALLTFDFYDQIEPFTIAYAINGHSHTLAWPFPWTNPFSTKTLDIPVSLPELHAGDNVVTFSAGDHGFTVMNVDLVLAGAGGIVSPG